jgi:two-component system sensor histidine kinase CiaH
MAHGSKLTASFKIKRLRTIFIIYWFLLAYVIAALVWWFIALMQQNNILTEYKLFQLHAVTDQQKINKIQQDKKRKTAQYVGEGIIFLLLIIAGAIFVFRVVRRQFKQSQQQQNFMMAITHELKTPIAVTKLNLETLQKHKLSAEQQQHLLANTLQEANRLNDLCNNMLLASQIEAGGYKITNEEIDLTTLVYDCIKDFIIRYPHRNIETGLQPNIYFTGDRLLLQIAVNNLLDNAIKYSPREGKVSAQLRLENNIIMLSIKDEGKGIPEEEKEKVFDKFYRAGNMHTKGSKGTGLGLFLTKKIVQQHNGNIILRNNQPHGCNFVISFKGN